MNNWQLNLQQRRHKRRPSAVEEAKMLLEMKNQNGRGDLIVHPFLLKQLENLDHQRLLKFKKNIVQLKIKPPVATCLLRATQLQHLNFTRVQPFAKRVADTSWSAMVTITTWSCWPSPRWKPLMRASTGLSSKIAMARMRSHSCSMSQTPAVWTSDLCWRRRSTPSGVMMMMDPTGETSNIMNRRKNLF